MPNERPFDDPLVTSGYPRRGCDGSDPAVAVTAPRRTCGCGRPDWAQDGVYLMFDYDRLVSGFRAFGDLRRSGDAPARRQCSGRATGPVY